MSEVERTARTVERGGDTYLVIEAWRGASDHGLCYFVKLTASRGSPDPDDAGDRRAPLAPSERLDDLSERQLDELLDGAVPLTVTERRFEAPDDRLWLAQSVGPVWAESGVAEGTTGVLFTSLQGPRVRFEAAGGHVGRMGTGQLVAAWRRAREATEEPDEEGLEAEA